MTLYTEAFATDPFQQGAPAILATNQSGQYSANGASYAFDKTLGAYISNSGAAATFWIQAQYAAAWTMNSYALMATVGYLGRLPSAWTMQGSNDGSTWTTVDTRTGETSPSAGGKNYVPSSPGSYSYYRLTATATQSGNDGYGEVAELWMSSTASALPRLLVGSGTWVYDGASQAVQQTDGSTSSRHAFLAAMPRSAANYSDVTADITLVADPSGRKHQGLVLQSVDGPAATGIRVAALDGTAWLVDRYNNGTNTSVATINHATAAWAVGETKTVRAVIDSAGKGLLFVNGAYVGTWTDTTYSNFRPGFHSYGATSRFDNVSYADALDLSGTQVQNLVAFPYSSGGSLAWDPTPGATSYDYRVDGGAATNIAATRVALSGLTNGTTYNVEVRPKESGSTGAWRSISLTPAPALFFDDFERANVAPGASALGNSVDGKTWAAIAGGLGITGGFAYSGGGEQHAAIECSTINMDVLVTDIRSGAGAALSFRAKDASNYWMLYLEATTTRLYRRQGGTFYTVYNWPYVPADGTSLRVICFNERVRLIRNGAVLYDFVDSTSDAAGTRAGLRLDASSNRVGQIYARPSEDFAVGTALAVPNVHNIAASAATPTGHVYKGRDTKAADTVGAS